MNERNKCGACNEHLHYCEFTCAHHTAHESDDKDVLAEAGDHLSNDYGEMSELDHLWCPACGACYSASTGVRLPEDPLTILREVSRYAGECLNQGVVPDFGKGKTPRPRKKKEANPDLLP